MTGDGSWIVDRLLWIQAKALRDLLAPLHPDLFDLGAPRPFKINFDVDLIAAYPDMDLPTIRRMLRWLTIRRAYLSACVAGADRYGLTGPDGAVSESQARHAKYKLRWRNRKYPQAIEKTECAA